MRLPFRWKFGSRHHAARIAAACRAAARALGEGTGETERDFLAVGGKLEAIVIHARSAADAISGPLAALGDASGEAMAGALDEIESWARGLGDTRGQAAGLSGLEPVVAAVRTPLEQLSGAARMLRVTGIVTRVESARLGGHATGFLALADDVGALAADIEERSSVVQVAVEDLRRLLAGTRESVTASEGRQHHNLLRLLEECRAALEDLGRGQERVRAVSARARDGYGRMVEEVGRIVVALQFHDSTRQRLEHVSEALSGLAGHLESGGGTDGAAALVRLQSAQVAEARRAFVQSVGEIRRDLEEVQETTAELVRAAGELGGGEGGPSAAGHAAAAAGSIAGWIEMRRSLGAAAEQVAAGCARIGGFVEEIRGVGMRLLRLALNAEVEAVRLADSGAVMEAVAEGIRGVSQEASGHAEQAGEALSRAEAGVAGFARGLDGDGGQDTGRAREAEARLRQVCAELDERAAAARQLLAAMAGRGAELSGEISALAAGLTADEQMEQACAACLAALAEAARAAEDAPGDDAGKPADSLASVAGLYTMQHEREVHATVAGTSPPPAAGEAEACASALGDNVELF